MTVGMGKQAILIAFWKGSPWLFQGNLGWNLARLELFHDDSSSIHSLRSIYNLKSLFFGHPCWEFPGFLDEMRGGDNPVQKLVPSTN